MERVEFAKLLICDLKLRKGRVKRGRYVPRRRVWRLKDGLVKEAYYNELSKCVTEQAATGGSVNEQYRALKSGLL